MKSTTKLIYLIILLLTQKVSGQKYYTDLAGFRIGQYRECPINELGKPIEANKYADGFEYEAFALKPDTSLMVVFEYSPANIELIWSIQLSGKDKTTATGIRDLKLGMTKEQVEKQFGKPDKVVDIAQFGKRWEYDKSNYSFEINPEGKLSVIKIHNPDNDSIKLGETPSFKQIAAKLRTGTNAEILQTVCPAMELYYKDSTYAFRKSYKTEEATDDSKLIALIRSLSKDLTSVDTKNPDEYEESARITEYHGVLYVMKIKKNHTISEIVFRPYFGHYAIWEIKTKDE